MQYARFVEVVRELCSSKVRVIYGVFLRLLFAALLLQPATGFAVSEDQVSVSFLPTWKLLNNQEKQQFIAGYISGWKDAEKVTEIALGYVRENPNKAVEGLEKIKSLYDLSDLSPQTLVSAIDAFYLEPANSSASLSRAVSAAKSGVH